MIIGGSGAKPATALQAGRRVNYGNGNGPYQYQYTNSIRYLYTGQPNIVDVIDISPAGGGVLQFSMLTGVATSTLSQVIITLDGTVVINTALTGSDNLASDGMIQVGTWVGYFNHYGPDCSFEAIPFNSSLKVQVKSQAACQYFYSYYLT